MFYESKGVALLLLLEVLLITHDVHAAVVRGYTDTNDGYCDLDNFGRIPVGEVGFDEERCEKAFCEKDGYQIHSCGKVAYNGDHCTVASGPGEYPECCPQVRCDDFVNKNKNWFCKFC